MNLSHVKLSYATNDQSSRHLIRPLSPAPVAERCSCVKGFSGRNCELCSIGYTREPATGGQFANCLPCHCSDLSKMCDPENNMCIDCGNHTTGAHCLYCISGYYRNHTTQSCLPCNCPGGTGSRNQFAQSCQVNTSDDTVICQECERGFMGKQCQQCVSNYHGNPIYENGTCRLCACNNNSFSSEGSGNKCDLITGQCLCAEGYVGMECEYCELGYYGDAMSHDCKSKSYDCMNVGSDVTIGCSCYLNGSVSGTHCNLNNGQCVCHSNVEGRQCNRCISGYWNIKDKCVRCNCSEIGSVTTEDCNKVVSITKST